VSQRYALGNTSGTREDWNGTHMFAPASLRVGVVGAGRVGAVLGAALQHAGHALVGVSAVSEASRARAASFLPDVPVLTPLEVAKRSELLLLAVPDDVLPGLVQGLGADLPPRVAHVSGRHGLAVLAGVRQPFALHPVYPFTGGPADLTGVSFGVTAHDLELADALVRDMGGVPVHVEEELRPLWHAALAHGANHLVTLVASAADMLRAAGADDPGRVLRPLLTAALDAALDRGDAALTGPVMRGDAGTVRAHLDVVPEDTRDAYLALARLTAARAGTTDAMTGVLQ
jgi:predicted short-subunit dehydrogenase-like oxidoreductase (DUF2520 family)